MEDYCPFCIIKGKNNKRTPFMINFEEAVILCSDDECNNLQNGRYELININHVSQNFKEKSCKSVKKIVPQNPDLKSKKIKNKSKTSSVNNLPLDIDLDELLNGFEYCNNSEVLDPNDLDILGLSSLALNPYQVGKVCNEGFKYPLWKNENNLCWLHSLMCVIVHNNSIRNYVFAKMGDCPLKNLISGYDECVALLNSESTNISFISETLISLRNEFFRIIKPIMGINMGECENPWFALWALSKEVGSLFDYNHHWEIQCHSCGYKEKENKRKFFLTFPTILDHLSLPANAYTSFQCSYCSNPSLKRVLKFESYPKILALQFEKGIAGTNICDYDFDIEGASYRVSSFIQYITSPNHFITWIRDFTTDKWLYCNDLNPVVSSFKKQKLDVKNSEIHILFWEQTKPVALDRNLNAVRCDNDNCVTSSINSPPLNNAEAICNNWVNEDTNFKGGIYRNTNISLFSDHSNSTASLSETASTATSFDTISNFDFKTNQSTRYSENSKNLTKQMPNRKATTQCRKNIVKSLTRNCKTPESVASSTASEVSNASDGDTSIASSMNGSGRWTAYKAHLPSKKSKLYRKSVKSPPKTGTPIQKSAKPLKSHLKNALKKVQNTNSDKSLLDSINSLLDQTSVFLNKTLNS